MSGCLHFNDSQWPIVILTAPVQWGAETIARYAEDTARLAAGGRPYAMILDLSRSALLPITGRSHLSAQRRWLFGHRTTSLVSEAVVVHSRAAREFFAVPPDPDAPEQRFCTSLDEALEFSVQQLRARGVSTDSVPPRHSGVAYRPLRKASSAPPSDLQTLVSETPRRVSGKL